MRIALLPLRLRLDKHVITFLCAFIAPQDPNYADFEAVDATAVPLSEDPAAPQPAGLLPQHPVQHSMPHGTACLPQFKQAINTKCSTSQSPPKGSLTKTAGARMQTPSA